MNWRKILRRGLTIIFILASLLTAVVVCAAIQIFDGTGQYIMSDFESHDIAKQRAQQRAEKNAQKQAGVYLKTFSRSVNSELTDDEISAVTNNIIKVSDVKIVPIPFETNGEAGLMYRATLKASIDPEGIYDFIKRDSKEKVTIIQQNNELQDAIAKNDTLIEDLKEQYKRATSQAEKDHIIKQMNDADRDFLSNQKFEEGNRLAYQGKMNEAIKLYTEAISINPNNSIAYNGRGNTYIAMGANKLVEGNSSATKKYYQLAIEDFNKAIKLNPNYSAAYGNRGFVYHLTENYSKAIKDFNRAIELDPNNAQNYIYRASYYSLVVDDNTRALTDFNKAIELEPNNGHCYGVRGIFYSYKLKDYNRALEDFTKAIQVEKNDVMLSVHYYSRGSCYEKLKMYDKAIADYNQAISIMETQKIHKILLPWVYHSRGECYKSLDDESKAQADFAKAKEFGYAG